MRDGELVGYDAFHIDRPRAQRWGCRNTGRIRLPDAYVELRPGTAEFLHRGLRKAMASAKVGAVYASTSFTEKPRTRRTSTLTAQMASATSTTGGRRRRS
jgi:hypothetical protein